MLLSIFINPSVSVSLLGEVTRKPDEISERCPVLTAGAPLSRIVQSHRAAQITQEFLPLQKDKVWVELRNKRKEEL